MFCCHYIEIVPIALAHLGQGLGEILLSGMEKDPHPVTLAHFLPCIETNDKYWEDDPHVTRLKCLGLTVITPIVHAISLVVSIANRIAKVLSGAHFWHPSLADDSLADKSWAFGGDILRIALSPIIYIGLELSALYGLLIPDQGKKLYAAFERYALGRGLCAPCFQPYATYHLGGGTPGERNAW